ncbi:hypothetical protein NIES37_69510 (plasmid) [Tolypothrix tenuis PCC 7101]|uniref:Flagellar assembly protein H n=1 Tax=Tolypothrix tenuis PCC 7101 TaxID=231146 RepID=A0A1Z4NB35_9CYAN|nr:hypothetical protein [Aulosira sp. FACHB-113]MBD2342332.1 hypothetical protein [Calothrix sp. FACHB-156]BAZ02938.1 hypothetical protein NIES37_69510 [Tolypothrix tenuis PCC 7101]BAZ78139.1 hypothetical protein NIES50_67720 [Aulosira laxa NIES-50]
MTRKPYDQFSKQLLEELLLPLGNVQVNREVTDEIRQVDILFSASPTPQANQQSLGLLGKIAVGTSLLEPFRNQPTKTEVRNCLLKVLTVMADSQRKAKREDVSLPEDNLARLWILAPSASPSLLNSFGAKLELDNWSAGVYFLADSLRTAIVAINQLPVTSETLWLRLLGKGETQRQAVTELLALPDNNVVRQNTLKLITNWRIISIQQPENLTQDDQELIMNLSQAYQEWEETTKQKGQREVVENLLRVRFGNLDEELSRVVDRLLQLQPEEFTPLCIQLSREELLTRFAAT